MRLIVASLMISLGLSSALLAAPGSNVFTDPAEAGPDFALQGEYTGKLDDNASLGLQVVARGKGKFLATTYSGGLPGAGADKASRSEANGETVDGTLVVKGEKLTYKIKAGVAQVEDSSGKSLGKLTRIERASPTLGLKPPTGAVVLFDGSNADAFKGGKVSPEGWLMEGSTTNQTFGDCTLHLEFRTPFQPEASGQGRGNSGCYLQGRYEVQVLDSFGLVGKNNEAGGIYETSDPAINMCLPPLSWQTYDVEYTAARYDASGTKTQNARLTVRHNGVVVQDNVEVPKATRAAPVKEGPEAGPLYLQNHGNPVRFRNIWLKEKK